jgi:hypothetical protein
MLMQRRVPAFQYVPLFNSAVADQEVRVPRNPCVRRNDAAGSLLRSDQRPAVEYVPASVVGATVTFWYTGNDFVDDLGVEPLVSFTDCCLCLFEGAVIHLTPCQLTFTLLGGFHVVPVEKVRVGGTCQAIQEDIKVLKSFAGLAHLIKLPVGRVAGDQATLRPDRFLLSVGDPRMNVGAVRLSLQRRRKEEVDIAFTLGVLGSVEHWPRVFRAADAFAGRAACCARWTTVAGGHEEE